MSSDSDDDMPLARSNGRGEFPLVFVSLGILGLFTPQPNSEVHALLPPSANLAPRPFSPCFLLCQFTYRLANTLLPVSEARISKQADRAMDKASAKARYAPEGVSVRNGPILDDKMEIAEHSANGAPKRKARVSTGKAVNYNVDESESSDDAVPLVWPPLAFRFTSRMRSGAATNCAYTMLTRNVGQASKGLEEKGRSLGFGRRSAIGR